MRCGFYDTFMKWTVEGEPNSDCFSITNAHKDMRYIASVANETGALSPIQAMVKNSFAAMEAAWATSTCRCWPTSWRSRTGCRRRLPNANDEAADPSGLEGDAARRRRG